MAPKLLMVLNASIIFTLGVVHLVYTFWGPKLTPRDPALQISGARQLWTTLVPPDSAGVLYGNIVTAGQRPPCIWLKD